MSRFDAASSLLNASMLKYFADPITYTPSGGVPYSLNAVLDSGEAVQSNERVYQTAWAPLANFVGGEPAKGDTVVIGSITYLVSTIEKEHLNGRRIGLSVTYPR